MVPATLVGTDTPPLGIGNPSPVADDPFELEIGVEGNTVQCIVGDACLPRLPRALWDSSSSSTTADGGRGGGRAVRIVPVLFTQGIDIQQSMTHAARDAREKAAFQVMLFCFFSEIFVQLVSAEGRKTEESVFFFFCRRH